MKEEQMMPVLIKGWNPNPWIAAVLSFLFLPMGAMYVGKKKWAIIYFAFFLFLIGLLIKFTKQAFSPEFSGLRYAIPILASVHMFYLAKKGVDKRPYYSKWYAIFGLLLIVFCPLILVKIFYSEAFIIPSNSMSPTMKEGDVIYAIKWGCGNYQYLGIDVYKTKATQECEVKRGDVIVFQSPLKPNALYIKRVVALGGDTIAYIDKKLIVNKKVLPKEFLFKDQKISTYEQTIENKSFNIQNTEGVNHSFRYTKLLVPENHLFVIGDNRDHSADSRVWGLLPNEKVVGLVQFN